MRFCKDVTRCGGLALCERVYLASTTRASALGGRPVVLQRDLLRVLDILLLLALDTIRPPP